MKRVILSILVLLLTMPAFCQRVLVFPFDQKSGDIKSLWLETGLSASIEESLIYNSILTVPTEHLENYFKEQKLISRPKFPLSSQIGLARKFGASHLIRGEYTIENEKITIDYSIFDLTTIIKKQEEGTVEGGVHQLQELTEQIARKFVESINGKFNPCPRISNDSFESYIRGRSATDPILKEVYFRRALDIKPDYYDAKCLLAIVLKEENEISESVKILEELKTKSYSKSSLGLRTLGEMKMELGKFGEAKELFLLSLKDSENAEGHILLARLYLKQGKKEDALNEIKIAGTFGTHKREIEEILKELK
jgi:hypothetical protein